MMLARAPRSSAVRCSAPARVAALRPAARSYASRPATVVRPTLLRADNIRSSGGAYSEREAALENMEARRKEKDDLAKLVKMLKENPELAEALKKAAGSEEGTEKKEKKEKKDKKEGEKKDKKDKKEGEKKDKKKEKSS